MAAKEALNSLKTVWKRAWFLLWKDDSFRGWIFSIAFLFVFIKFIFFPLLSLAAGTTLPLAIVESCSMYHEDDIFSSFDSWWEIHEEKYLALNISKDNFYDFSLEKGFNKGDIIFTIRARPEKLKVGDVIIFSAETSNPIIHRIINISVENSSYHFSTMGDNNNGQLNVEKNISESQILGKAVFKLAPLLGWTKLIFYDWRNSPEERGFCSEN